MGFRDDNEALRARIQTLESEKEQLSEEKQRLESALARQADPREGTTPEPESATATDARDEALSLRDTVMERVAKRDAREKATRRETHDAAATKRAKTISRLQKRNKRVRVRPAAGGAIISVRPGVLRDPLREQLPWGFGFALINPGIFIVIGLAFFCAVQFDLSAPWILLAPLMTWVLLLTLINVVYAKWKSPPYRLVLTGEHFALYKRGKEPILFGMLGDLKVDAPDPNPAELHRVRVSDGRAEETIDFLSADDIIALKSAIRSGRQSKKRQK